jgi:hypothetical protein
MHNNSNIITRKAKTSYNLKLKEYLNNVHIFYKQNQKATCHRSTKLAEEPGIHALYEVHTNTPLHQCSVVRRRRINHHMQIQALIKR